MPPVANLRRRRFVLDEKPLFVAEKQLDKNGA
jgi:hypothetical protein